MLNNIGFKMNVTDIHGRKYNVSRHVHGSM